MSLYARIQDDVVFELIETDGDITQMFHPSLVWVNVDDVVGIQQRWSAALNGVEWSFAPYVASPPTVAEILASQSQILQSQIQLAESQKIALAKRIAIIQDAIDNIEVEGAEEFAATPAEEAELPVRKAQLTNWKNYSILLGRIKSQPGWPETVTWLAKPAGGMDIVFLP